MKTFLAAFITFSIVGVSFADEPQGPLSYDFSVASGAPLWDFAGQYASDTASFTIDQQSGWGTLQANDRFIGFVSGNNIKPRLTMAFRTSTWAGEPFSPGSVRTETAQLLTLKLDPATLTLVGKDTMIQKQRGYDPFTFAVGASRTNVTFPLTDGNDGHWNLSLNLLPLGNYLNGDATVNFADGSSGTFIVHGFYNPDRDNSRLLLVGTGQDRGSILQLNLDGSQAVQLIRGRVRGERLSFRPPASPAGY
jgi:hypothetical protein